MKQLSFVVLVGLLVPAVLFPQTRWQTTRDGTSTGQCQLQANKITVTIHPFFVDVEEDAVIAPTGDVSWGDPSTLELIGEFSLTKGSCLRSVLLWQGTKILKAKLRDRLSADSAYESTVNRVIPHDPVLLEYLGNDRYRFRIFPVAENGSRKIRILYCVPQKVFSPRPQFRIATAFTGGASQVPSQISVEIRRSPETSGNYLLAYGNISKTVQFNAVYQIPASDMTKNTGSYWNYYWNNYTVMKPLLIMPDTLQTTVSYTASVDTGRTAGHYTAIYTVPPDTIAAAISELNLGGASSVEAMVLSNDKGYIADWNASGFLGIYLKSTAAWDSTVYWRLYNTGTGKMVLQFPQKCRPHSDSATRSMLPLVWAAKYSLAEGLGNLGALYGFADPQMSFLALESDTLSAAEAKQWNAGGVPPLLPQEIVCKRSDLPSPPDQNVIFDFGSVVATVLPDNALVFSVMSISRGTVCLRFHAMSDGTVTLVLLDIRGRAIKRWETLHFSGSSLSVQLPRGIHGCFVLRASAGSRMFQKKFLVAE